MKKIDVASIIGKGYNRFWHFKGRYRVVKGGRGSKKSATTALWYIYHMMKMPLANLLVIRKAFNTHKDSTYAQLKWAINRLGVAHLWKVTKSPLEITYIPTGQKILFRGLDDPMSITSITVDTGYLCFAWFEEAYQVTSEDDFDKIDMSIRGELPPGYFKQITLTFNPWNEKHWIKARFFDVSDPNILAITTNYMHNEFLGDDDRALFEWMKVHRPRRYQVEGKGNWGIAEGVIFDNWQEKEFDLNEIRKRKGIVATFGLDFGYVADPTALAAVLVDKQAKEIFIFDEHYQHGMLNNEIADMIKYKGYAKERIIADSAEPKSIDEIRKLGISRITAAQKGPDSVVNGIQFLKQFTIYVHPKCTNAQVELANYVWDTDKKTGKHINKPIDDYNHFIDALRYAMEAVKNQNKARVGRGFM